MSTEDAVRLSAKRVFENNKNYELINEVAIIKFNEFKLNKIEKGVWYRYIKFGMVSETTIRIYYHYGYGDMEYEDSFEVGI